MTDGSQYSIESIIIIIIITTLENVFSSLLPHI